MAKTKVIKETQVFWEIKNEEVKEIHIIKDSIKIISNVFLRYIDNLNKNEYRIHRDSVYKTRDEAISVLLSRLHWHKDFYTKKLDDINNKLNKLI